MEAISPLSFTNSKSLCEKKKKMHTDILKLTRWLERKGAEKETGKEG